MEGLDKETMQGLERIVHQPECDKELRILKYICREDRDRGIILLLFGVIKNK